MQQVKIRIQELTGARVNSCSKSHHGTDGAVDKARAKLGIHNKSAEQVRQSLDYCFIYCLLDYCFIYCLLVPFQDLAAFDAELLVREGAARASGSSR
jgi:hypothetical protein